MISVHNRLRGLFFFHGYVSLSDCIVCNSAADLIVAVRFTNESDGALITSFMDLTNRLYEIRLRHYATSFATFNIGKQVDRRLGMNNKNNGIGSSRLLFDYYFIPVIASWI